MSPRRSAPSSQRACARRVRRKFSPPSVPDARSAHHVAAMEVTDAGLLANRGIVVTRPAHQATPLAEMIRAAGGHPLLFPVIEIADIEDSGPLNRLVDRLDEVDCAIFVSPNAVY